MRFLPEDLDAERVLLSTLCAPGAEGMAAECLERLVEEDFTHPNHRMVCAALRSLIKRGEEVSAVALLDALGKNAKVLGGMAGLVEILSGEEVGRPMALVEILARHRRRRELIRLGAQVAKAAEEGEQPPEAIADTAAKALADLQASGSRGGLVEVRAATAQVLDTLQGTTAPGTFTGFSRLDAVTQGFQPGQLIVLAARPGIGKSTLVLNWLLNAASTSGWCSIHSLEMQRAEVVKRLACNQGNVPAGAVKERRLTQGQLQDFLQAIRVIEGLPMLINDAGSVTAMDVRSQVLRECTRRGCPPALVVVDYLQLVSSPAEAKGKSEALRIGEISRAFKLLAKDAGAPVVVLSQLNREIEKANRKPVLSDLRDSGAIEQDADIVAFIHRPPKPQMGDEPDRSATLVIAKHRDGPTAEIPLEFHGGFCRYEEVPERNTGGGDAGRGWV